MILAYEAPGGSKNESISWRSRPNKPMIESPSVITPLVARNSKGHFSPPARPFSIDRTQIAGGISFSSLSGHNCNAGGAG